MAARKEEVPGKKEDKKLQEEKESKSKKKEAEEENEDEEQEEESELEKKARRLVSRIDVTNRSLRGHKSRGGQ
jgi:hypothetical protein